MCGFLEERGDGMVVFLGRKNSGINEYTSQDPGEDKINDQVGLIFCHSTKVNTTRRFINTDGEYAVQKDYFV